MIAGKTFDSTLLTSLSIGKFSTVIISEVKIIGVTCEMNLDFDSKSFSIDQKESLDRIDFLKKGKITILFDKKCL